MIPQQNIDTDGLKKKKRKKKKSLCPINFTNKSKLPIGLSECNDIREKPNKNHTDKVPSKAANS